MPRPSLHSINDALTKSSRKQYQIAKNIGISAAHLSKVLNGERNLTPDLEKKLLQELGYSADAIQYVCPKATHALRKEICDLLYKKDEVNLAKIEPLLTTAADYDYFQNELDGQQELISFHATLAFQKKDYETMFNHVSTGLERSLPSVGHRTGCSRVFDEDNLHKLDLSVPEIRLLDQLAVSYCSKKSRHKFGGGEYTCPHTEAKKILSQIYQFLAPYHTIPYHTIPYRLHLKILYNYSKLLGMSKDYAEAIKVSIVGLSLSETNYNSYYIPRFLNNKGCALYLDGQQEAGKQQLRDACQYLSLQNNKEVLKQILDYARDKLGIPEEELIA